MLASLHSPVFSILCVIVLLLLYLPCQLRFVANSFQLSKDKTIARLAKCLQKKHVFLGKLFPVLIIIHAVTSFSQIDINVVLGLICLVLVIDFPGRRRRKKGWMKIHERKGIAVVLLVFLHILIQFWM